MSSSNANGPIVIEPKPSLGPIGQVQQLITDAVHYVLRLYFSILLLAYFWCVKVITRALQPFEPLLEQMHKIPASDVNTEGIKNQFSRLLCIVLLYLAPLYRRAVSYVTRPIGWARDRIVEYVEKGEKDAARQTDPKQS